MPLDLAGYLLLFYTSVQPRNFNIMANHNLISRLCSYVDIRGVGAESYDIGVGGLSIFRTRKTTTLDACLYSPMLCLILQGSKEVHMGTQRVAFSGGQSVIVSHDTPIVSRITEASMDVPYVALSIAIDIGLVRSLVNEIDQEAIEQEQARAFEIGRSDQELIDAMERLFELADRPAEAKVLAPLISKEIHFRLLVARHGSMLRQLLQKKSNASRISKALAHIKESFNKPLSVADLADVAGMSPSSLHEYFKEFTSTTPLQFQKDLRLLEARRLLMDSDHTVSSAAFEVGYQSPTQFSREYSRKFGISPSAHKNSSVAAQG